jgi:hypothetical protein
MKNEEKHLWRPAKMRNGARRSRRFNVQNESGSVISNGLSLRPMKRRERRAPNPLTSTRLFLHSSFFILP